MVKNNSLEKVSEWIREAGLTLFVGKTEEAIMSTKRWAQADD